MSQREEKISKLLEFPYDAFLMVRLEYVRILGDELEAKLLRIIEKYVEQARKNIYQKMLNTSGTPPPETVEIARDIWVPISYRLFMNDLFGTVTSENTVKKALKHMIDKRIIFHRFEPKKQYDAPEYKIHVNLLQMLLNLLKVAGYQYLIPSIFDTLKTLPPQELTPSEYQILIPSTENSSSNQNLRVSKFDTNIREGYDNNITGITENSNGAYAPPSSSPPEEDFSEEDEAPTVRMPAIKLNGASNGSTHTELSSGRDRRDTGDGGILRTAGRSMGQAERATLDAAAGTQALQVQSQTSQEITQQTPGPGALPPSAEPPQFGSSHGITRDQASSSVPFVPESAQAALPPAAAQATGTGNVAQERTQEKPKRGRKEASPIEELPPEVVQFLDDWDSLHRAPLPRTDRLIALAKTGVQAKVTREELEGCRNWLPTTDRPGKPYYRHKGVGLWDVIDKIGEYRSLQNMPIPGVPLADMKRPAKAPGTSDFDNYKGNGVEEREAQYQEALARLANGTLIE